MTPSVFQNLKQSKHKKLFAGFLILAVLCMNFPQSAKADTLAVDVQANGQTGNVTLASTSTPFTVTWTSTGATACEQISPSSTGVATSGSSVSIDPSHPWYPTASSTVTFTISCTDGTSSVSNSVTVALPGSSGGGTPGGGGSPTPIVVDVLANGSNSPTVTIASGTPVTISWTSSGVTACEQTSPSLTGVATNGSSVAITPGHPWYPTLTTPTVFTISCTDGVNTAQDTVTVALAAPGSGGVTVDVQANGSNGPLTLASTTTPFTVTWTSTGATACEQISPSLTGVATNGNSISITPGHPWYPTATSTVTFTISCTDGTNTAQDSVVVGLPGSGAVTVDVKINGSDGPLTIASGTPFTVTWTSTGATACEQTSPSLTGVATNGNSVSIDPTHPWYPTLSASTTFTISCTNGTNTAQDSAIVGLQASSTATSTPPTPPGGGGGGGGGGSSSSSPNSSAPLIPNTGAACLFIKDYMRQDFQNDPIEVMKLQSFLKVFEGYDYVQITGNFDQATFTAVEAFQEKYRGDILDPWALPGPTGYVYILTLKKINELYCLHAFPLNEAQAQEIVAFRDLITGLTAQGINVQLPVSFTGSGSSSGTQTIVIPAGTTTSTSTVTIPIVGVATTSPKGQNPDNFAAALFSAPASLTEGFQCLYEFLLILVVLYILGSVLEDVLYKKEDLTKVRARFFTKWTTVMIGLVIAGIIAYFVGEYCLLLPLMIALIIALVWSIFGAPKKLETQVAAGSNILITPAPAK